MSTTSGSSRRALQPGPSGWLAAPALAFFLVFAIIPLLGVLFLSFTSWDGLGEIKLDGLSSWTTVLTDPVTGNALLVTAKIMFFSFIVQAPISLLLGVFTAAGQKYRAALAVLYFVPLLLSSAAVAIAFKALLDPNFGLGAGLGLPVLAQDWLGQLRPGAVRRRVRHRVAVCPVPHADLPRRRASDPRVVVRGRADRRCRTDPTVLQHHAAPAEVHRHHLLHAHGGRIACLLRPRLRPHRRRSRLRHAAAAPAHVPHRVQSQRHGRRKCPRRHPRRDRPGTRPAAADDWAARTATQANWKVPDGFHHSAPRSTLGPGPPRRRCPSADQGAGPDSS